MPDQTPKTIRAAREIGTELAKDYPKDFPEIYSEGNTNMDRLFVMWYGQFGDRFSKLLTQDFVDRYEEAHTDAERQAVIAEIKEKLY